MTIPIVFAIDNNVVIPCGVTITSLLLNAGLETFYDIYILCNQSKLDEGGRKKLNDAFMNHSQCSITFIDVSSGVAFKETDWQTTGHLTTAAFYRLVIPLLFPQFDRVIYADVDMIFQRDLTELFVNSLQQQELIAAVLDLAIDDKCYFQSDLPSMVGKSVKDYFNSGFMVMNLKQMRDEKIVEEFNRHAKVKYDQNDQDVLNVVCNGRVQFLPVIYNFQMNHFASYMWGRTSADICFGELFKSATLHYTGKFKPWNSLECVSNDTWWHYYKMSPFYDDMVYFKRQYDQIESHKNDFRVKSNNQLLTRVFVNIKHKLFG